MMIGADLFVMGVTHLIRLGGSIEKVYLDALAREDVKLLPPMLTMDTAASIDAAALMTLQRKHGELCAAGGPFEGLFKEEGMTEIDPGREPLRREAIAFILRLSEKDAAPLPLPTDPRLRAVPRMVLLTYVKWEKDTGPLWGPFAQALASSAIEIIGANPNALGLGKRSTMILTALTPALDHLLKMNWNDPGAQSGRDLLSAFATGALEVLAAHPEVISSDRKLKPLIDSVLLPLQQAAQADPTFGFLARDRIEAFFSGPVAIEVLKTLDKNADQYLKGEFTKGSLLGDIARATLADFTKLKPGEANLVKAVSERGLVSLTTNLLTTLEAQPERFVRGKSDATKTLREFLVLAAGKLKGAKPPFDNENGVGAEIISAALDAAAKIATSRLAADMKKDSTKGEQWAEVWQSVGTELIDGLVEGLKLGLTKPSQAPLLETVFSEVDASELFKMVAATVAAKPQLILPSGPNAIRDEVAQLVSGIAAAIAADGMNLLGAEDWKKVIAVALAQAAKNPSVLFSITKTDPASQIAVVVIKQMLTSAASSLEQFKGRPGAFLFGKTLSDAINAALEAAAETVVAALSESERKDRFAGLESFMEMLDTLIVGVKLERAPGQTVEIRLGAGEWLEVFRHFVAQVIKVGTKEKITVADIAELLFDWRSPPATAGGAPATGEAVG